MTKSSSHHQTKTLSQSTVFLGAELQAIKNDFLAKMQAHVAERGAKIKTMVVMITTDDLTENMLAFHGCACPGCLAHNTALLDTLVENILKGALPNTSMGHVH